MELHRLDLFPHYFMEILGIGQIIKTKLLHIRVVVLDHHPLHLLQVLMLVTTLILTEAMDGRPDQVPFM